MESATTVIEAHTRVVTTLPRVSLRAPEFVRHVIAGMKGPFVDNVVTDCTIEVTHDVFEWPRGSLDIHDLAWRLAGKHDPKKFNASASVRLHADPSGTYLLFPSENMVMTGVRCPELVLTAALRIVRYYSQMYGRICRLKSLHINNVHGVIMMGYPIDLELLHRMVPNSYRQPTNIKCVIMRLDVPLRSAPEITMPPMGHMLRPTPTPDFGCVKTLNELEMDHATKQPARKRRKVSTGRPRVSEAVMNQDWEAIEDEEAAFSATQLFRKVARKGRMAVKYTVSGAELEQTAEAATADKKKTKKPAGAGRKRVKNPNHVAVNVWESGKVVMLGRSEEHLIDAATELGRLLAEFTMNKP